MQMTQQQCELHANRLRQSPHVFSGVVTSNSRGVLVFCPSGTNGGTVNPDRDGIEISSGQAKTLISAGAMDLRTSR